MLNKLRNSKWQDKIATPAQVKHFTDEARAMIERYGWQNKDVRPYSYKWNVVDMVEYIEDFERCTFYSKQYLITLANGLCDVLNAWEDREVNGIAVRNTRTGDIIKLIPDELEFMLSSGAFELA